MQHVPRDQGSNVSTTGTLYLAIVTLRYPTLKHRHDLLRKSNNSLQILACKVCQALQYPCSGFPIERRGRYVMLSW